MSRQHRQCEVAGCSNKHEAKGYCIGHYHRYRRGVDVGTTPVRRYVPSRLLGASSASEDTVQLAGAHERVKALWGPARRYPCIECGEDALHWAYDGTDPTQRLEGPQFYSRFPEFYIPMCRKCHAARDRGLAWAELLEFRQWKHRTGLTLAEIEPLIETKMLDSDEQDIESAA